VAAGAETAIVAYTLPVWTVMLARPLLGERLTASRGLGLVLGLAGVSVLVLTESPAVAWTNWTKLPGVVFTLMGALLFALGAVLSKRAPLNMPPFAAVGWQTAIGVLPLLAGMLVEQPDFRAVDALGGLAFVSSGALANGLGYITWFAPAAASGVPGRHRFAAGADHRGSGVGGHAGRASGMARRRRARVGAERGGHRITALIGRRRPQRYFPYMSRAECVQHARTRIIFYILKLK
jgi:uncharacterized membrane protein